VANIAFIPGTIASAARMHTESHFAAFAVRRLVGLLAVVVIAPSVTFVVLGSLGEDTTIGAKLGDLPAYLHRTFVEWDFGDLGTPTQPDPVSHIVLDGLPVDLALLAGGMAVGIALGVGTGLVAGPHRRGAADRAMTLATSAALSMPVYWMALVGLFFFSPVIGRFGLPFTSDYDQYVPLHRDPLRWLQSLWVPWVVLGLPIAAMTHRMVRATLAEIQDEDYLQTARAKGLRERRVQWRHALPAALPPVLGLLSVNMALLVTNVALIEPAFNLPGAFRRADIGQFLGETAPAVNLLIVQALIVEAALLIAGFVLLCDLLQARMDPRILARR
jgi:peptide/nickel transport system permease protein